MRRIGALLSVMILSCSAGGVRGEDAPLPLDNNFLIKVAPCEHAQIEIDKLADKRAASPKVKEFAAQMVQDHQKCYDKLAETIKNHKIAVVSGFEKDKQADIDRLGKLQGAEFDREFLAYVIKHHQDGIAMFESQVKNGKNAELRTFADEALPKLREHLKHAQELAKIVN
jgi:putative membrane protein